MSQSVKIPNNMKPNWICEINGKVYSYAADTTQTVPDEVANLIAQINAMKPTEADEEGTVGQVWTKGSKGAGWKNIPATPDASATVKGLVKQGAGVADATDATDVITQFNALIDSLVASGALAEYVAPTT